MELRHLRYFVVAAEECHFTRAAQRLGIAQPPLSMQLGQLETELGFPLFHRLPRGVTLTEAGRDFLDGARAVLARLDHAIEESRQVATGAAGLVRIGFTSSAAFNDFVLRIIGLYRQQYPAVVTRLHEAPSMTLLQELRAGELDIAFIRLAPDEGRDLPIDHLMEEEVKVALPANHRLASRSSVRMAELAAEKFVLFPHTNGRSLYEAIIAACQRAGFTPDIAQEAPQMASSISLVAAGVGIAIVPQSMTHIHSGSVCFLPIEGDCPTAVLQLATRKAPLAPAAVRFRSLVMKQMKQRAPRPSDAGAGPARTAPDS